MLVIGVKREFLSIAVWTHLHRSLSTCLFTVINVHSRDEAQGLKFSSGNVATLFFFADRRTYGFKWTRRFRCSFRENAIKLA